MFIYSYFTNKHWKRTKFLWFELFYWRLHCHMLVSLFALICFYVNNSRNIWKQRHFFGLFLWKIKCLCFFVCSILLWFSYKNKIQFKGQKQEVVACVFSFVGGGAPVKPYRVGHPNGQRRPCKLLTQLHTLACVSRNAASCIIIWILQGLLHTVRVKLITGKRLVPPRLSHWGDWMK